MMASRQAKTSCLRLVCDACAIRPIGSSGAVPHTLLRFVCRAGGLRDAQAANDATAYSQAGSAASAPRSQSMLRHSRLQVPFTDSGSSQDLARTGTQADTGSVQAQAAPAPTVAAVTASRSTSKTPSISRSSSRSITASVTPSPESASLSPLASQTEVPSATSTQTAMPSLNAVSDGYTLTDRGRSCRNTPLAAWIPLRHGHIWRWQVCGRTRLLSWGSDAI
jgi:hypothetical protein